MFGVFQFCTISALITLDTIIGFCGVHHLNALWNIPFIIRRPKYRPSRLNSSPFPFPRIPFGKSTVSNPTVDTSSCTVDGSGRWTRRLVELNQSAAPSRAGRWPPIGPWEDNHSFFLPFATILIITIQNFQLQIFLHIERIKLMGKDIWKIVRMNLFLPGLQRRRRPQHTLIFKKKTHFSLVPLQPLRVRLGHVRALRFVLSEWLDWFVF